MGHFALHFLAHQEKAKHFFSLQSKDFRGGNFKFLIKLEGDEN